MERAVDFYSRLGLRVRTGSRMWSVLECGGGAVLGLHQDDEPAATAPLRVELTLVSPEPLTLAGWLAEAGVPQTEAIVDEGDLHARPPDRVGG